MTIVYYRGSFLPSSAGWKLVSFLLSKPTPNSICGTEHEPKLPMAAALGSRIVIGAAFTTDVNARSDIARDANDENILLCCRKEVA